MSLKFIAISGTTGVTENLYLYEYGNDLIMVDCGVGFPEMEMYGVDLVIPDFTYIIKNKNKLRGILITHGHEDHLGALPFLLREVNAPIYSTRLVSGFIEDKLSEYGMKNQTINIFDPERDTLTLGAFRVVPFRVSHSIPDSVGFMLDTPEGKIFHAADFKFDWTPVDAKPFDINKVASLASGGALAVVSDCLGATSPGYTESEREIEGKIEAVIASAKGQIFFTTISSNISRIQQALNVAGRVGRKVSFIGRSIERKAEIARNLGYLHFPNDLVIYQKRLRKRPKGERMFVISGSYGQPGSALYRVALGEHDHLALEPNDVVIFSGDPAPPGSKVNVDFVVDRLIELNADVHYYDMQEDLHVSGHGSQKDIEMLLALIRPKYFIPIGGTIRHMRAFKDLAMRMGAREDQVFKPLPGDVIEFKDGRARMAGNIPTKEILVDGLGIGDVGNIVLRDRQKLAQDGIAIVLIEVDRIKNTLITDPEIISRGFVYHSKMKDLLTFAGSKLRGEIQKHKRIDKRIVRDTSIDFLEKFFYTETGRRPMILPLVVEI